MTLNVGMIGFSEGNGHPFSFSAIINGYSHEGMAASGWPGIYAYLRRRDASEFGGFGMRITHAWSQDPELTERLCAAAQIENLVASNDPTAMLGEVDAVILARDDYQNHAAMAIPFLEAGLPVFLDKPLALDLAHLRQFAPYLRSGALMSCSGMRYARELDEARSSLADYGELRLIRGAILNDWAKYGVHLVDAALGLTEARPLSVTPLAAPHQSLAVQLDDGCLLQLDALGNVAPCFDVSIYGTNRHSHHTITDNFSMFRRLLFHFAESIRKRVPAVEPADTLASIGLLIAGELAMRQERTVTLDELGI